MHRPPAILALCILIGCSSGNAPAKKFMEAVAAVKVCAVSGTPSDLHRSRLELESHFEAHARELQTFNDAFRKLSQLTRAMEHCYEFDSYNRLTLFLPTEDNLWAMQAIHPAITNKLNTSHEEMMHDSDFFAPNYIAEGRRLVERECNSILARQ